MISREILANFIPTSFLALVIMLAAHTMGSQCLEGRGNDLFIVSMIVRSFSLSKPASTRLFSPGKRFLTRGETLASTMVRQRQTYRMIVRRITRPRSSWPCTLELTKTAMGSGQGMEVY